MVWWNLTHGDSTCGIGIYYTFLQKTVHWWQSYLLIRRKFDVLKCIAENDLEDFSAHQAQELWSLGWELRMALEHLREVTGGRRSVKIDFLQISAPSEAVSLASGKVCSHFEHRRYWIVIQHCFEWPDLNLHASIATTLLLWHAQEHYQVLGLYRTIGAAFRLWCTARWQNEAITGPGGWLLDSTCLGDLPWIPWGEHKKAPCFCFQGFLPAEFEKARAIITNLRLHLYFCLVLSSKTFAARVHVTWLLRFVGRHLQQACVDFEWAWTTTRLSQSSALAEQNPSLGEYKSSMEWEGHCRHSEAHWRGLPMSWQTDFICIYLGVNRKILQLCEVFI